MNDHRDLEGVYALVTGATSGIRRATAGALVRHGAEVVVHGRNAERGGAVVDAITAGGAAEPARAQLILYPGFGHGTRNRWGPRHGSSWTVTQIPVVRSDRRNHVRRK
jgi:NAD(P)-dependent dehydrogenase (short-subunit alcohol dehydrogenase family)